MIESEKRVSSGLPYGINVIFTIACFYVLSLFSFFIVCVYIFLVVMVVAS